MEQSPERPDGADAAELRCSLLVFDAPLELDALGALEEGDARFQVDLGGGGAGDPGRAEGYLLAQGVAATVAHGGACATILLGPFRAEAAMPPLLELPGTRTSPIHTFALPGARLRVALRSVEVGVGRRRFLERRFAEPALRGRRCGLRRDDAEPRAVLAERDTPTVLLAMLPAGAERLLMATASLEASPV